MSRDDEGLDVARAFAPAFLAQGRMPPFVRWSPADLELAHPVFARFAAHLRDAADAEGRLWRRSIDVATFPGVRDWLMLLERDDPASDLRYRHYGAGIADHFGRDMTGQSLRAFGGHISDFFEALYAETARRREIVLSVHEPPAGVFVSRWRRLLAPLLDDDGEVNAFVGVNIPENDLRAGLDIVPDPVLVADGAQRLHYLNRAARDLFGLARFEMPRLTLLEATGVELDLSATPEEMVGRNAVTDSVHFTFNGAIAQRCMVTTSGVALRGRCYYVVMVRLLDA